MSIIGDGRHELSGVGQIWIHDDWNDDEIDGVIIRIDGVDYVAYVDPSDGWRSYGAFVKAHPDEKPQTVFTPQEVFVKNTDEDGEDEDGWPMVYHMMSVYNADGELILGVGTDHSDQWYPHALFYYNPSNLPINKNR